MECLGTETHGCQALEEHTAGGRNWSVGRQLSLANARLFHVTCSPKCIAIYNVNALTSVDRVDWPLPEAPQLRSTVTDGTVQEVRGSLGSPSQTWTPNANAELTTNGPMGGQPTQLSLVWGCHARPSPTSPELSAQPRTSPRASKFGC